MHKWIVWAMLAIGFVMAFWREDAATGAVFLVGMALYSAIWEVADRVREDTGLILEAVRHERPLVPLAPVEAVVDGQRERHEPDAFLDAI